MLITAHCSLKGLILAILASSTLHKQRLFIKSDGFKDVFDLPADEFEMIISNEKALLNFSQRFLKQVLFGENSIALRADAADVRLQKKQQRMVKKQKELNDEADGKTTK